MSNMDNKDIFAKNLLFYLKETEKTQKDVALAIGVTPASLNEWIKAKKYPRIDKIELLARYFGIVKSDLIEDNTTIPAIASDVSEKIKQLRSERGMTLEQVAKIVGVGKSTVRKWETGTIANMKIDKIVLLAKTLDTTPSYLLGLKDNNEKENPPDALKLTEGEMMLLELFRQIPEDAQKMYLEVLRASSKSQS